MTQTYFAPDSKTIAEVEKERVIPDPRETVTPPSKIDSMFGIVFPMGIGTGPIFMNSPWAMYYIFVMVVVFVIAGTAPLRAESAEHRKKGTPIRIILQFGTGIIDFVTRYFTPRILVEPEFKRDKDGKVVIDKDTGQPIHGLRYRDFCTTTDESQFTIKDRDGELIMEGEWLSPEMVERQVDTMVRESAGVEEGVLEQVMEAVKLGLGREEIQAIVDEASDRRPKARGFLSRFFERVNLYRGRIIKAIILAFVLWVFWDLVSWFILWFRSGTWIWW